VICERSPALAKEARERSSSYWFLSELILAAPTAAGLTRLAGSPPEGLTSSEDPVSIALSHLRFAIASDDPDTLAQRLAPEHARLTGGLKAGYGPRPPYESVYREGTVMGERTMDVLKAYRDAGLDPIDVAAVPGDHLGIELKFLALACYREAEARDAGDAKSASSWLARQARFLEGHLAVWVSAYCADVRQHTQEPYYLALADLVEAACRVDLDRVRQLAESPANV